MHFQLKSRIRPRLQPLQAHRLALTVDGLNRMPILAQLQVVQEPRLRLHVRPPHGDQPYLGCFHDARLISGAVVALVAIDPCARRQVNRQLMGRGQVMQRARQQREADGNALRGADQMQAPAKNVSCLAAQ